MKTFSKSIAMGFITTLAAWIAIQLDLYIWMVFIAWCSYYLFGASFKTSLTTFTQQFIGVALAILCQTFTLLFSRFTDGATALLTNVFLLGTGLFYVTKLKSLNILPAYFTGLIIWFASQYEINFASIIKIVSALCIGYSCGLINTFVDSQLNQNIRIPMKA